MKKIFVSIFVVVVFAIYAIFYHNSQTSQAASNENIPTAAANDGSSGVSQTTKTSGTAYKNGEYTGSAANAYYGTIQVKAVIQNGKITDVQFLQSPHDQEESVMVNQQAMPNLKQEAIQSQSANVDIVSGATQSSQAFRQSLASALSQAK